MPNEVVRSLGLSRNSVSDIMYYVASQVEQVKKDLGIVTTASKAGAQAKGLRVIYFDERMSLINPGKTILDCRGAKLNVAIEPQDIFSMIKTRHPDLIVLELIETTSMIELVRKINALMGQNVCPIIVIMGKEKLPEPFQNENPHLVQIAGLYFKLSDFDSAISKTRQKTQNMAGENHG